jgi:hypothetical protein
LCPPVLFSDFYCKTEYALKKYAALLLTRKTGRIMLGWLAGWLAGWLLALSSFSYPLSRPHFTYSYTYLSYHKIVWFSILF